VTVPSARCSARARPIADGGCTTVRPLLPGHDHDPDPAARKADEPDWRAQPAPSHAVDPDADQPTTPWLPQPDGRASRTCDARKGHLGVLGYGY
jgi:hypothetical protein